MCSYECLDESGNGSATGMGLNSRATQKGSATANFCAGRWAKKAYPSRECYCRARPTQKPMTNSAHHWDMAHRLLGNQRGQSGKSGSDGVCQLADYDRHIRAH